MYGESDMKIITKKFFNRFARAELVFSAEVINSGNKSAEERYDELFVLRYYQNKNIDAERFLKDFSVALGEELGVEPDKVCDALKESFSEIEKGKLYKKIFYAETAYKKRLVRGLPNDILNKLKSRELLALNYCYPEDKRVLNEFYIKEKRETDEIFARLAALNGVAAKETNFDIEEFYGREVFGIEEIGEDLIIEFDGEKAVFSGVSVKKDEIRRFFESTEGKSAQLLFGEIYGEENGEREIRLLFSAWKTGKMPVLKYLTFTCVSVFRSVAPRSA